jgi:toxin ParE1/3/4
MPARRWRTSALADEDLARIALEGLELYSLSRVEAYVDDLIVFFDRIAEFPLAARERTELQPGLRMRRFHSHAIFYRVEDRHVLIIRILHGHQDWAGYF